MALSRVIADFNDAVQSISSYTLRLCQSEFLHLSDLASSSSAIQHKGAIANFANKIMIEEEQVRCLIIFSHDHESALSQAGFFYE